MSKLTFEVYGEIAELMKQRQSYMEQHAMLTRIDNKLQVVTNQDGRDNLVGNIRCPRIVAAAANACNLEIAAIDNKLEALGFDTMTLEG